MIYINFKVSFWYLRIFNFSHYLHIYIQGGTKVGYSFEYVKQSLFLYHYLLIIISFSIQKAVNLLLPHPVFSTFPTSLLLTEALTSWLINGIFWLLLTTTGNDLILVSPSLSCLFPPFFKYSFYYVKTRSIYMLSMHVSSLVLLLALWCIILSVHHWLFCWSFLCYHLVEWSSLSSIV